MKMVSILLRLIAILGACAAVAGWVLTQGKVDEANAKLADKDKLVADAQAQATDARNQLETLQGKIKGLDSDLGASKDRESKALSQYATANRNLTSLQNELQKAKSDLASLKSDNDKLKRELIGQRTSAPDSSTNVAAYESKISALEAQVKTLTSQLADAQAQAQAAASAVTSSAATAASTTPAKTTARVDPTYGSSTYTPAVSNSEAGTATESAPSEPVVTSTATVLKMDTSSGIVIISQPSQGNVSSQTEFGIVKGFEKPLRLKASRVEGAYIITNIVPGQNSARVYKEGDTISIIK
ncbi:hypothetical protein H5P28_08535 [Ruficoccus amylovorans]|uniref:Chromosome partition protein Smc n=1 Tax=Ruficoccus amylovorans TaxID=1804625 RepID=A0A842HFF9_9BACT|nr:hypothetical protein [Ruficoccus amylovorans]MBC2594307.1 hypothetical protein [Ruficoccus amylovorans]